MSQTAAWDLKDPLGKGNCALRLLLADISSTICFLQEICYGWERHGKRCCQDYLPGRNWSLAWRKVSSPEYFVSLKGLIQIVHAGWENHSFPRLMISFFNLNTTGENWYMLASPSPELLRALLQAYKDSSWRWEFNLLNSKGTRCRFWRWFEF